MSKSASGVNRLAEGVLSIESGGQIVTGGVVIIARVPSSGVYYDEFRRTEIRLDRIWYKKKKGGTKNLIDSSTRNSNCQLYGCLVFCCVYVIAIKFLLV